MFQNVPCFTPVTQVDSKPIAKIVYASLSAISFDPKEIRDIKSYF